MSKPTALRLFRALRPSICASCRSILNVQPASWARPFSNSGRVVAKAPGSSDQMLDMMGNVEDNFKRRTSPYAGMIPRQGQLGPMKNLASEDWAEEERHFLHIYSHKHNTHLTLTKPNNDALISVSCGNIGFRKAGRGSYDAAYQLAAFVMSRIKDKGLLPQIQKLEIVYRGFGPGREAVTKAILGNEGKMIRPLITRLSDSTRLKFGGVRSKKPRRLG